MQIALRPARAQDFDYCASLYFADMEAIIRELNLDAAAHAIGFRKQWELANVRIITLDGTLYSTLDSDDIGWLQTATRGDALYLAQLFVDAKFQRRGIGTEVMHRLIREASQTGQAMTLSVVKTNPAFRLYERLGFRITQTDDRKFHMRRDLDTAAPTTEVLRGRPSPNA